MIESSHLFFWFIENISVREMDIDNLDIAIFQVLIETKSILWWFSDFMRSLYSIESFKGTGSI